MACSSLTYGVRMGVPGVPAGGGVHEKRMCTEALLLLLLLLLLRCVRIALGGENARVAANMKNDMA